MTNMENIIQQHNLKVLINAKEKDRKKLSNFRSKGNCTLKSDSHLPKNSFLFASMKTFKNDKKLVLFHVKNSFRS